VHGQVISGAVSWTKPIFRFDHEDPTKTIIIHAAGIYNGFKPPKEGFSKEQKLELSKAGISPKKSWGESALAKGEYVFTLVDNKHPDNGIQVSNETSLLGDKVKDVIADRLDSVGKEAGDPFRNPYAIKFMYNGEEENPQAKYKARALEQVVMTPLIKKLIIETDPPDVERMVAPFNQGEMRTYLETHCLLKSVPWDDIFDVAEGDEEHEHEHTNGKSADDDADEGTTSDAAEPEEDDMVACDQCNKPMKATETKCANCGAEYDVEPEEKKEPPPPPKQIKKRSEMKKGEGRKDGMPF
jgi:hypothetical protein